MPLLIYDLIGYISVALHFLAFVEKRSISRMLYLGIFSALFLSVSLYGYGGMNGVFVSILSIFIKLSSLYFSPYDKKVWAIRIFAFLSSLCFVYFYHSEGIVSLIPAFGIAIIAFADTQKSLLRMKLAYLLSPLLWLFYGIKIGCWSAIVYDVIGIIALLYSSVALYLATKCEGFCKINING